MAKTFLPFAIEAEPPGLVVDGVGGARKRMKNENFSMELIASSGEPASGSVMLFGWVAGVVQFSSRSVWKRSFEMPISTLYASPENISSDLFCAFHPKRAIVPSLPLLFVCPLIVRPARKKLARPRIPSEAFCEALAARFARMAESGIISINPAPKVGVGILKMTFRLAIAVAKSGCFRLQPGIANSACTPPSGDPSGLRTNRASRAGPFNDRNGGTLLPILAANAICGFSAGLVPPEAGWL